MAYATFDQLRQQVGDSRLAQGSPASPSTAQAYWEAKLEAASAQIDLYLDRGGYSTPVVFSSLAESHRARASAWMAEGCMILALRSSSPASVATPRGVKSASDQVIETLEKVASGALRLPWLAKTEPVIGVVTSAQIDSLEVGVPPLSGAHFSANRMPDY